MRLLYLTNKYSQQRQHEKAVWVYPVLLAMEAEWHRQHGDEVDWNFAQGMYDKIISEPEGLPFLELPAPDRVFTEAFDRKYQNYGNYKFHPATHMQVADGCWHGKCTFCVENKKTYQVRQLKDVIEEVENCYKLGFKEVFDDSGTFPDGNWLRMFLIWKMTAPWKLTMGCNMRIGADVDYGAMKQAGFRMVLFGVESANQFTLDKIQKGIKADDIIPTIIKAEKCGLEPHIAVMFGYPWESVEDEENTLRTVHWLLKKGYAKTAQASFYQPTCDRDRQGPPNILHKHYTKRIYNVAYSPEFWYHQIKDIRSFNDFKYLLRKIKAGLWR